MASLPTPQKLLLVNIPYMSPSCEGTSVWMVFFFLVIVSQMTSLF